MPDRDSDIKKIVKRTVAERFTDARLVSVEILDDCDGDGEPIIRIKVVYDTETGRLEPRRLSSFLRHLRSRLAEVDEERFPLMSFISRADAESVSPEAA